MTLLLDQWEEIAAKAATTPSSPTLLYREPELAVRVIREEFNADYRGVVIDDQRLYEDVAGLHRGVQPRARRPHRVLRRRGRGAQRCSSSYHVHEQVHKALDRKVWLPSGGSLIIEHTEALTVIDVNTGKNVGTSNLEETVFHNNMEAADEIAKQLRLRDIGGIIVIDFIDMEIRENRAKVVETLPQRAVPGQDPLPGVRHLRPRPRRDDPQAHRRGPAHRVLRDLPRTARAAASSSTTRCSTDPVLSLQTRRSGGFRGQNRPVGGSGSPARLADRYVRSDRGWREPGEGGRRPAGPRSTSSTPRRATRSR